MASNTIEFTVVPRLWRIAVVHVAIAALRPFGWALPDRLARRITGRLHDFALVGARVLPR